MKPSKFATMIGALLLVVALAVPAMAQVYNSETPGSLIVFPKFISGKVTIEGVSTPKTQIELSVLCPEGLIACREGLAVKIRLHWVCPGSQEFVDKYICKETDFFLTTTVGATLTFNPDDPFAVGSVGVGGLQNRVEPPECERGFLVAWVVDIFDNPINFNGLIGDVVLREKPASAAAYNAIPIQAIATLAPPAGSQGGTCVPPNAPSSYPARCTDTDGDGALDFDGVEYALLTGKIYAPVRFEDLQNPRVETHLTLLTLDVRSNRSNNPTFVDFDFYNQFESAVSRSHEFICWSEVRLTDIGRSLTAVGRGSPKGLLVSEAAEKGFFAGVFDKIGPVPLLGIVETIERNATGGIVREYSYSMYHDTAPVENRIFVPGGGSGIEFTPNP